MTYWLVKDRARRFLLSSRLSGAPRASHGPACAINRQAEPDENEEGERALFYHTGDERQAVGIVEVIREAYPTPRRDR